jgi:hypothetical protein
MLPRTAEWFQRKAFPPAAKAALGWGAEYWDSDPIQYEDWEAVRDRLVAVSRERNRKLPTKADLAAELWDHLLDDVLVELMPRQVYRTYVRRPIGQGRHAVHRHRSPDRRLEGHKAPIGKVADSSHRPLLSRSR